MSAGVDNFDVLFDLNNPGIAGRGVLPGPTEFDEWLLKLVWAGAPTAWKKFGSSAVRARW